MGGYIAQSLLKQLFQKYLYLKRKFYKKKGSPETQVFFSWRYYCNDPKFSDRQVWANSADPDKTAPTEADWSGSTLFAIPIVYFVRHCKATLLKL